MKRKYVITGISVITLGLAGGIATLNAPQKTGALDSPIVQQINNHEARIRNLETDTSALQAKTNTPSSGQVAVPPPPTAADLQTATSAPATTDVPVQSAPIITVTAFREIVIDADNSDCEYTYSDGTNYRFEWKRTKQQGAWITDGVGQNGHWVKSTQKTGICDSSVIGQPKS